MKKYSSLPKFIWIRRLILPIYLRSLSAPLSPLSAIQFNSEKRRKKVGFKKNWKKVLSLNATVKLLLLAGWKFFVLGVFRFILEWKCAETVLKRQTKSLNDKKRTNKFNLMFELKGKEIKRRNSLRCHHWKNLVK